MEKDWSPGGASALSLHAPAAAAALADVVRSRPRDLDAGTFSTIRVVTAEAVDLAPLGTISRPVKLPHPVVVAFAEQFAVDVSTIDLDLRAAWHEVMGAASFAATQVVYVADLVPRMRAALDALFGPEEWLDPPIVGTDDMWSAVETFMREVARLDELDATTTELVRLRGARLHECRVCSSRRSLAALQDGARAETFAAVDHYRSSELPDTAKAALAFTDAMIWTPSSMRHSDLQDVRRHLTPAQAVEVVLDVTRNAANKIAVALGADAPVVISGVELFETDADGNLTFP